jgi:type IV pilus assembly protein PilX
MSRAGKHQSGVVLLVALIILLLLTIIMITAMRMSSLEERMAGNMRNKNIAFQAAESALREAEAFIDSGDVIFNPLRLSGGPFQTAGCTNGLCGFTTAASSETFGFFSSSNGAQTATTGISNIIREPEYIIDLVEIEPSTDSSRVFATFQITTRAMGGDNNSRVQLQSTFRLHTSSFAH